MYIGSTIQSIDDIFKQNGYKKYTEGHGKYVTSYKLFENGIPFFL